MIDIVIENSTDDDATVKVSPGGIGKETDIEIKKEQSTVEAKAPAYRETHVLKPGSSKKLSIQPDCTVHFLVPVEVCTWKPDSTGIKRLKLARVTKPGYELQPDTTKA